MATITVTASPQAWAWLYTYNPGSRVDVDWVRVTPHQATDGTLVSCAIDAEETTAWGNLTWAGDFPAGTTVAAETRSSADGVIWSAWSTPLTTSGSPITSPAARYLQYRLTLSTTNPLVSPEVHQVLVSAQRSWRHTTLADFNQGCALRANTSVADIGGGELRLAAALEDYFYEAQIDPARWNAVKIFTYGGITPTVSNGLLAIDGSYLRSVYTMTQPIRLFEARARLRVPPDNTAWGDIGFGRRDSPGVPDLVGDNRLFITNDANLVQANARNEGDLSATNVNLPGVDASLWHTYRIAWYADRTDYFVDGSLVATNTLPSTYTPYVWLYAYDPAGSAIEVDWTRVDYYPSASGTYQSCALDAGQATPWGALTWAGSTPRFSRATV